MKKLLILFLALCFTSTSLSAQESEASKLIATDSVLYCTTFYFEKNQGEWIEKYEYIKVVKLLKWAKTNASALIDIKGWADPSGTEEYNARLSFKRARAIRNYLVQKGIEPSRIIIEGKGEDSQTDAIKARRADVLSYIRVTTVSQPKQKDKINSDNAKAIEPNEQIDPLMQAKLEPEQKPESQTKAEMITTTNVSSQTTTSSKRCSNKEYFIPRTNLLYWVSGMINLGLEYKKPESNFAFVINGGYSPFGHTTWNHNFGGWFLSPEIRYYIPRNDKWFVGIQLLAGGYNIKLSDTGRQGTVIGGGVMGGYKITLSDSFDMDFTVGLGYDHLKYDTYYHNKATSTNHRIERDIINNSIMPIQAGVNLRYKF